VNAKRSERQCALANRASLLLQADNSLELVDELTLCPFQRIPIGRLTRFVQYF
jgi:hypothetical protein